MSANVDSLRPAGLFMFVMLYVVKGRACSSVDIELSLNKLSLQALRLSQNTLSVRNGSTFVNKTKYDLLLFVVLCIIALLLQ